MPMDEMVAEKPEVYGLRKGWTGAMMGMMTLIRVLPPELYDKIMDMKRQAEFVAGYNVSFRTDASPPPVGEDIPARVSVTDPSGDVVSDALVRMTVTMPAMPGMAEMRSVETLQWTGSEYTGKLRLAMGGAWNVSIEVQRAGKTVAIHRTRLNSR